MTKIDLVIKKGATFRASIYYKDINGAVINLANKTAKMQIRSGFGTDSDLFADLVSTEPFTSNGDITITANDGGIHLHIPDEVTSTFNYSFGWYDLYVYDTNQPTGDVESVSSGKITFENSTIL